MISGIIVVDYQNQVKRHNAPSRSGQYDWTEQIEISKALKYLAQDENVLVAIAVQTNENNFTRFSRGIFDAVDAAIKYPIGRSRKRNQTYLRENEKW